MQMIIKISRDSLKVKLFLLAPAAHSLVVVVVVDLVEENLLLMNGALNNKTTTTIGRRNHFIETLKQFPLF